MVMANSTSEYKLPYKIQPLLKPYNARNYAFDCIHEFIRIVMVVSAYVGTDCLFGCTSFHLSGQLAILKCRVKEISKNTDGFRQGIRKIILRHQHLIRLADILEDSFNIIIGQNLFGITIQICVSSYQMLSSLAVLEKIDILTFILYDYLLLVSLFTYCYIGECIIKESTSLCEEFYFTNWYEMPTFDIKSICICMMRTRKQLQLTCAKFCILTVSMFINVYKQVQTFTSTNKISYKHFCQQLHFAIF
ncbi:odorant receptor 4-like [Vespa crabro]|uniref:odorant receptor 4-like n=1 Tax=Vespa crabro TaxID=7445 RepID=UPI001F002C85|nr:odorant receptor 4-like [Vespa crabro]